MFTKKKKKIELGNDMFFFTHWKQASLLVILIKNIFFISSVYYTCLITWIMVSIYPSIFPFYLFIHTISGTSAPVASWPTLQGLSFCFFFLTIDRWNCFLLTLSYQIISPTYNRNVCYHGWNVYLLQNIDNQ